jgi:transcriptional regulator with XRE-family HTH domain
VDVCLVIKQRLEELGLDQRGLAANAEVTESYISQLLTRKKLPCLRFPSHKLSRLADVQRMEELKRSLGDPPAPLFKEVRESPQVRAQQIKTDTCDFLKSSGSANSNASSHRSFRTWSRESPNRNWRVRTGFTWWVDSAAEVMQRCGVSFLSFWTPMSSTFQLRIVFPFLSR